MAKYSRQRLRPSDIKFTQDSIGSRFADGKFVSDTFQQLLIGRITVDDIPTVEVVIEEDGDWWALTGNRRLYIYRLLETLRVIEKIPVEVMSTDNYDVRRRYYNRKTTVCDGRTIEMRQTEAERRIDQAIKDWQKTKRCSNRNRISVKEALTSSISKLLPEIDNTKSVEETNVTSIHTIGKWRQSNNPYRPIPLMDETNNRSISSRNANNPDGTSTYSAVEPKANGIQHHRATDHEELLKSESDSDDMVVTAQPKRLNRQTTNYYNSNSEGCSSCFCFSCC